MGPILDARAVFFKVADTEAKFKVTDTGAKDERRLSDESVRDLLALAYWDAIKGTGDPGKLRDFLAEYGATNMARLARNRLTDLEAAAWARLRKKERWQHCALSLPIT